MKEIKKSELLSEVESIVHSQLDLNAILNNIMKTVAIGLKSEVASLFLLDEESGELKIAASYGLPEEVVKKAKVKI